MAIKTHYQPGEHVLIRLDRRSLVGKIIYCSLQFKDVVAVAFDLDSDETTLSPCISSESPVFYTGGKALSRESKRVGWSPVTVAEGQMTRRLVGGAIWVLDCIEGPVQEPKPPKMGVYGHKALITCLNRIVSEDDLEG